MGHFLLCVATVPHLVRINLREKRFLWENAMYFIWSLCIMIACMLRKDHSHTQLRDCRCWYFCEVIPFLLGFEKRLKILGFEGVDNALLMLTTWVWLITSHLILCLQIWFQEILESEDYFHHHKYELPASQMLGGA